MHTTCFIEALSVIPVRQFGDIIIKQSIVIKCFEAGVSTLTIRCDKETSNRLPVRRAMNGANENYSDNLSLASVCGFVSLSYAVIQG